MLAVLTALCTAILTFVGLFSPIKENSVTVEIPDLCGKMLADASLDEGLAVEVEYRYDANAPAGTVLTQSPAAGSRRKLTKEHPSCTLSLTVSMGKESLSLPNTIAMDVRDAKALLREQGFSVEIVTVESAYREGIVLSSLPKAGTSLPKGEKITLTVSAGMTTTTVSVPHLLGLSRSDALVALWTSQLAVGEVVEIDADAPAGTVVRQSHQGGTVVAAGTKITVYISRASGE